MNSSAFESPLGRIRMTSESGLTLTGLTFDSDTACGGEPAPVFDEAVGWLERYFAGLDPGAPPRLEPRGTEFQLRVWRALAEVGYGRTVTYGELARRVGCRSARAVGSAVGRNPLLLMIPCHRVVASGGLGGFSAGIELKKSLLALETEQKKCRPLH